MWGDNFDNDGSFRDVTALPRASHESITYGSAGLFMTAEDLARWSDALFTEHIIGQTSLAQMLTWVTGHAYGLGLGAFSRRFANGLTTYGHGGGNIGTTAWMVHIPRHRLSLVVMINAYDGDGCSQMAGKLIDVVLEEVRSSGG